MMKSIGKLTLATILAGLVMGVPLSITAQTTNTPTAPATKPKPMNFRGMLGAVDKTAQTITVKNKTEERVFTVTADTKIMKAGKPASLDDATVGDPVSGSYAKTDDGKMVLKSLRFGGRSTPPGGTNAPAK